MSDTALQENLDALDELTAEPNAANLERWAKTLNKATDESTEGWNTPAELVELVRSVAPIALDPCSNRGSLVHAALEVNGPGENPRDKIGMPITDGLKLDWWKATRFDDDRGSSLGLVYVNPPYGRKINGWVEKCAIEAMRGTEIVALLPARTDARWFQGNVFNAAQAICFYAGRVRFAGAPASAPFPSVLAYYGSRIDRFRDVFDARGCVVLL